MITWLLGTRIGRALSGLVAALGLLVGVYLTGKREGVKGAENDALKDTQKRVEKGREHLRDNRDKPNADRLRDNDSRW